MRELRSLTQTVPGTGSRNGIVEKIDFTYSDDMTNGFINFDFKYGDLISECNGWIRV